MADVVQWYSRRVAASVLVQFYANRRRGNRKRWKNRKVYSSLFAYHTHDAFDSADISSMQDTFHMWTQLNDLALHEFL